MGTLRFLEQEIQNGKIKWWSWMIRTWITPTSYRCGGEQERERIRTRTKQSLGRIKDEIAEKGKYTTKAGEVITKLVITTRSRGRHQGQ